MPKILLVEDEIIISEPLNIVLSANSFDVDVAGNGLEALQLCKKNTYDLILLDIMMPVCSGIEFLKKAQVKDKSPNTKVILLTNLSSGNEINEGLTLGADKYILKANITPKALVELVNNELK